MEFWLHTATLAQYEYDDDEMPLDLSDAWWEELIFHSYHQNECWQRVWWCMENNIPFTIRAYEVFSETQHESVENKEHYEWAVDEMVSIPATPMDYWVWFINIPDEKHSLMYKLVWVD